MVEIIDTEFGDTTVRREKKYTFFGIDIQLKDDGTVELSMDNYITECIETFRENIGKYPPTLESGKLFEV